MLGMSVIPVVLTVCPEIYSALVRMLYSGGVLLIGAVGRSEASLTCQSLPTQEGTLWEISGGG